MCDIKIKMYILLNQINFSDFMVELKFKDCLIEKNDKVDLQSYKGIKSSIPVQDILNISDEALDKYYEVSCKLLAAHSYKDAACAFLFLCFLTPLYSSFWLGLGIAEQCQEHHEEAILAYLKAIDKKPNDPIAYGNLAQCLLALGEKQMAQFTINKALELCGDDITFSSMKEKVLAMRDSPN